jgi:hypothetical protein
MLAAIFHKNLIEYIYHLSYSMPKIGKEQSILNLNPIFNESVHKPENMTRCTAHHLLIFGGGGPLSIWNMHTLSLASFLLSILSIH